MRERNHKNERNSQMREKFIHFNRHLYIQCAVHELGTDEVNNRQHIREYCASIKQLHFPLAFDMSRININNQFV